MTLPDVLNTGESVRLSRLEKKIADALTTASRPIGEALLVIRDEKLYRATHKGFGQYVLARWGFSRATAYRMIDQAAGLVLISPPENEKEQVNLSHGETKTTEEETTDDASTASTPSIVTPPASPSAGPPDTRAESEAPSGPTGDGEASAEGNGGGDEPADVLTPTLVISDADGLRWLSSKTEQEWRALGDPFGPGIRAKIKFVATAFGYVPVAPPVPAEKPQRRQGTVTRPSGEPKRQGWADRSRITTIPTIPASKLAKRHADDCRCLSCAPPKAAAK